MGVFFSRVHLDICCHATVKACESGGRNPKLPAVHSSPPPEVMSSLWTFDLYWHTDTQKVRRYRSNINSDVFSIKHSIVIKSDIKTQGFMVFLAKDHHPTYRPDVAWRKAAMGRRSIPHTVCAPSVKQTSAMAWSNDEITWWLWENMRHIQISGPASLLRWTNLGNIKLVSLSGNHGWIHVTCYVVADNEAREEIPSSYSGR